MIILLFRMEEFGFSLSDRAIIESKYNDSRATANSANTE